MEKNNKRIYIILLLIIVIYLFIFFTFFYKKKEKETTKLSNYINLVLEEDANFLYSDSKWTSVNSNDRTNYNWEKYRIYEGNNEFLGDYFLIYSGVFNVKTLKKEPANFSMNDKIAVATDFEYDINKFDTTSNNEKDDYINTVLLNNNIDLSTFLTVNNTILYDMDKDGKQEKIYSISNVFSTSEVDKTFNFTFMVDDNNIYMINKKIFSSNNFSETCSPVVSNILNIKSSNFIVYKCAQFSLPNDIFILYGYKDNKFMKIISN